MFVLEQTALWKGPWRARIPGTRLVDTGRVQVTPGLQGGAVSLHIKVSAAGVRGAGPAVQLFWCEGHPAGGPEAAAVPPLIGPEAT